MNRGFQKGNKLYLLKKNTLLTEEQKFKISQTLKSKGIIPPSRKGIKDSLETRNRKRLAQLKKIKDGNHNFWKGGVNSINKTIRGGLEYRVWRESVFKRDNFTCQHCGIRGNQTGGYLHAHHIKPFAFYHKLRFELDNGLTLCIKCHRKTDTFGHRALDFYTVSYPNNKYYQIVDL